MSLQADYDEVKQEKRDLETMKQTLTNDMELLKKEHQRERNQRAALQQKYDTLQEDKRNAEEREIKLDKKNTEIAFDIDSKEKAGQSFRQRAETAERETLSTRQDMERLNNTLQLANDKITQLSGEKEAMRSSNEAMRREKAILLDRLDAASNSRTQTLNDSEKHQRSLASLETKLDNALHEKTTLEDKNDRLKRSQQDYQAEIDRMTHAMSLMQERMDSHHRENAGLAAEVERFEAKSVSEADRIERLARQQASTDSDLATRDEELSRMRDTHEQLKHRFEALEAALERLRGDHSHMERERNDLSVTNEENGVSLNAAKREKATLANEMEKAKEIKNSLLQEIASLKRDNDRRMEELDRSHRQRIVLEERVDSMREQLNSALRNHEDVLKSRSSIQDEFDRLKREQPEVVEASERACAAATDEVLRAQGEVHRLQENSDRLQRERQSLVERTQADAKELEALRRGIDTKVREFGALDTNLVHLQRDHAGLQEAHAELMATSSAKAQKQLLRIEELEKSLSETDVERTKVVQELADVKETNRHMETEVGEAKEARTTEQRDNMEAMGSLQERLSEHRINIGKLESTLDAEKNENERLRNELQRQNEQTQTLERSSASLHSQIEGAHAEALEARRLLAVNDAEKMRTREEMDSVSVQLEVARKDNHNLTSKVRSTEADKLRAEAELRGLTRERDAAILEASSSDRRLATARAEADRMLQELRTAKRERDALQINVDELQREQVSWGRERESLDFDLDNERNALTVSVESGSQLRRELASMAEEIRALTGKNDDYIVRYEELRRQLEVAEASEASASKAMEQMHKQQQVAEASLKTKIDSLESNLHSKASEAAELREKLLSTTDAATELRATFETHKDVERHMKMEISDLRSEADRQKVLRAEDVADVQSDLQKTRNLLMLSKKELEDVKAEQAHLALQRSSFEIERDKTHQDAKRGEAETRQLQQEIRAAKAESRSSAITIEGLQKENARLTAETDELRVERLAVKQEHANVSEELSMLRKKVSTHAGNTSYSRLLREAEELRATVEKLEGLRAEDALRQAPPAQEVVVEVATPMPVPVSAVEEDLATLKARRRHPSPLRSITASPRIHTAVRTAAPSLRTTLRTDSPSGLESFREATRTPHTIVAAAAAAVTASRVSVAKPATPMAPESIMRSLFTRHT